MEFTIRITNPQKAKKFAKYLSAFGTLDHISLREESQSQKPLLEEIARLMHPKEKAKKAKLKVNKWADNRVIIQQAIANMSEAEKEEARIEHENVKRMVSLQAKVFVALRDHYEKTKDHDQPSDTLVLSIKELLS